MARTTKRTKRDNGTGSIYKDGNGYRVQVLLSYDPATGEPRVKKVRTTSHAKAVEALRSLQAQVSQGRLEHSASVQLKPFVESWLEHKVKKLRAPKTYSQYKWVLETHVLPTLGRKRLDQIKRRDVQALVSELANQPVKSRAKDPTTEPTKTLSRRTLQAAVAVLHSVFEDAIRDGHGSVNPCDRVELPKESKKPPTFLTAEQVVSLIKALEGSPVRDIVRFMLATGVRLGEATGVRWQDIDLKAGLVRIAGQLQATEGKLKYIPTTKTNQDRILPLPKWLVEDLISLRSRQLIEEKSDPEGIVFLSLLGNRLHGKAVHSGLASACIKAEFAPVSPHKLRHTAATLALMETGDLHAVQKLLGHQQSRLTADLYAHATAERLRPVSDALGRLIEAPQK